eukprot:TRINITY_DN7643_c0_g1_i2.p1 TRINITY_DN7643_c0_g1~~TRINITY_DN7643_c0_g1_i2.p1  ORF type:complete len:502 (+),score=102.23 TRINITY_DN7643_c0_g1_i2:73-1578(+)
MMARAGHKIARDAALAESLLSYQGALDLQPPSLSSSDDESYDNTQCDRNERNRDLHTFDKESALQDAGLDTFLKEWQDDLVGATDTDRRLRIQLPTKAESLAAIPSRHNGVAAESVQTKKQSTGIEKQQFFTVVRHNGQISYIPKRYRANFEGSISQNNTVKPSLPFIHLLELPDALLGRILSHLTFADLIACAQTCRRLHQLSLTPSRPWAHLDFGGVADGADDQLCARALRKVEDISVTLTGLELTDCPAITDASIQMLTKHAATLQTIVIRGCNQIATAAVVSLLMATIALTSLTIERCDNVDEAVVRGVLHCTKLSRLSLSHLFDLRDEDVLEAMTHCSGLTRLSLKHCPRLTAQCIVSLPACTQELRLESLPNLSDDLLDVLASVCGPSLRTLSVAGCNNLTDKTGQELSLYLSALRCLDLSQCYIMTDDTLFDLAQGCKHLVQLNLSYCINITNRGVIRVAQECLKLADLDLRECSLVSTSVVARLREAGICVRR